MFNYLHIIQQKEIQQIFINKNKNPLTNFNPERNLFFLYSRSKNLLIGDKNQKRKMIFRSWNEILVLLFSLYLTTELKFIGSPLSLNQKRIRMHARKSWFGPRKFVSSELKTNFTLESPKIKRKQVKKAALKKKKNPLF